MGRIPALDADTTLESARELLRDVQRRRFGATSNMTNVMANNSAPGEAQLGLSGTPGAGTRPPPVREPTALSQWARNAGESCLSAHTRVAEKGVRVHAEQVTAATRDGSDDPFAASPLRLAISIDQSRDDFDADELAQARAVGLTDEQIGEIIGHVALIGLTNLFNKAMAVDIDFRLVKAERP